MPLIIDAAVAKTHKYALRESGDTVEVVERPGGGFSLVIVDGQGSGAAAKLLSLLVAGRAVGLLSEGVRDGAAARAAHDYLYATRGGKVSAALDIVSVDLASATVLFTRNSELPMVLRRGGRVDILADSGRRIGVYRHTRPRVLEFPAEAGLLAVLMTDGVLGAGERFGAPFDVAAALAALPLDELSAQAIADAVLDAAIAADQGRPGDDMTVVVLKLGPGGDEQPIRRMRILAPVVEPRGRAG